MKFGSGAAQPDTKAKTGGLPDLNAALLEQQKQLDELLKKQNAQLKKQDADTQTALENSRQMLRDMENDGLLAKGTADTKPEHLGSFEGLATEVKKTVLGQDAFVDAVVRAMRSMASPGRGGHPPAMRAAEAVYDCRCAAAALFKVKAPERVVFTMNATHALNIAIASLARRGTRTGASR